MNKNYTLCFDTCLEKMYLTLALNNEILASEVIENHDSKYHSESTLADTMQHRTPDAIWHSPDWHLSAFC